MSLRRKEMKKLLVAVSAVSLVACGGGGGGSSVPASSSGGATVEPSYFTANQAHLEGMGLETAHRAGLDGTGVNIAVIDVAFNTDHDEFSEANILRTVRLDKDKSFSDLSQEQFNQTATLVHDCKDLDTNIHGLIATSDIVSVMDGGDLLNPVPANEKFCFGYDSAINTGSLVQFSTEQSNHGAHVSGLIAGKTVGVAPDANLYLYSESLASDVSTSVDSEVAFYTLHSEFLSNSIDIVSMSSGKDGALMMGSVESEYMRTAFRQFVDSEAILVMASFANSGENATDDLLPNELNNVSTSFNQANDANFYSTAHTVFDDADLKDGIIFSIGLNSNGLKRAESGYPGSNTDLQARSLAAPIEAFSAQWEADTGLISQWGLSQTTPMIAGAIAIIMECSTLNAQQAAQVLLDTADSSFAEYDAEIYGQGRLDMEAAYQSACI